MVGIGEQGHHSGAFDGFGQFSLVLLAEAGALGTKNFSVAVDEITENFGVFIINEGDAVLAKKTSFHNLATRDWPLATSKLLSGWLPEPRDC